jgi:hypothetical protein
MWAGERIITPYKDFIPSSRKVNGIPNNIQQNVPVTLFFDLFSGINIILKKQNKID